MVPQELVNAVMQERARDAARLHRSKQAQGKQGQVAPPRSDLSAKRGRRSLLSFVTRGIRTASVS